MNLPDKVGEFLTPAVCMHSGCSRQARWIMRISLWPKGIEKTDSNFLRLMLKLKVCDEHQNEIDPKTFWVPEAMNRIADSLQAIGKAEPDFKTAEFMWVPLGVLP